MTKGWFWKGTLSYTTVQYVHEITPQQLTPTLRTYCKSKRNVFQSFLILRNRKSCTCSEMELCNANVHFFEAFCQVRNSDKNAGFCSKTQLLIYANLLRKNPLWFFEKTPKDFLDFFMMLCVWRTSLATYEVWLFWYGYRKCLRLWGYKFLLYQLKPVLATLTNDEEEESL